METEIEVRRQFERLDEFSDDSALSLKELKRKIEALEGALSYMTENGLEPGVELKTPDKNGWKLPEVLALASK